MGCFQKKMSKNRVVVRGGFVDAWNGFARDDEDVTRGGGTNIAKSEHLIIFVNDVSGDFAIGDFLKQRLAHGATLSNCVLHDNEIAVVGLFGREAFAEVLDDLVAQRLAAGAPALAARQLFDAAAQALEANHSRSGLKMRAEFGAEALEEKQFAAFASGGGEFGKVGDCEFVEFVGVDAGAFRRTHFVAEAAEDFFEGVGKLFNGNIVATQFLTEIKNNCGRGFADDLWVEVRVTD